MKKSSIVKMSLLVVALMIFSGCIITNGELYTISLKLDEGENENWKRTEDDNLLVLSGKTVSISATGLDMFGNNLPDLSDPAWTITHDFIEDEEGNMVEVKIGSIDTHEGATVNFTAGNDVGASGVLYVTIKDLKSDDDVDKSVTINIKIVDEFPTEDDE